MQEKFWVYPLWESEQFYFRHHIGVFCSDIICSGERGGLHYSEKAQGYGELYNIYPPPLYAPLDIYLDE